MKHSLISRRLASKTMMFIALVGMAASWFLCRFVTARQPTDGIAEARLRELKLELPATSAPAHTYVSAVQVGDLLFVAGHTPNYPGVDPYTGKVGRDLDVAQAQAAARRTGLRILSTVREQLGSLDRVERVVKTLGMVNATEDFTQHPQVVNGCSDLMVDIFGPRAGKGARSAVGMASLPGGVPVEIEMVLQIRR